MPKFSSFAKARKQALSLLLCLGLLMPFGLFKPLKASGFSVSSSGSIDLEPGESATISFSWSGTVVDGVQASLSTSGLDGVGLTVSTPAGSSYTYADQFVGKNQSSGDLFTVTVTAGDQAVSGSLSVSASAFYNSDSYADSASAGVDVSLPATETTTTTTAAQTTTTEEQTTTTTTEEETTTTEATTSTAEVSPTPLPSPSPSPTPAQGNKLSVKVNGLTRESFALMNSNDAALPPAFVKGTEAKIQGLTQVTVFTKAGSLPLLYGALPSDTIPLFYLYDAADQALYSFYGEIVLKAEGQNWTIAPIQTPAPSSAFKHTKLNINGQTTSAYEANNGGEKIYLVYASTDSTGPKKLYRYQVSAAGVVQIQAFDPKQLPSAATSLSSATTSDAAKASSQGPDLMMIALIFLFVVLLAILGLLVYSQKLRRKADGNDSLSDETPLQAHEDPTNEEDHPN